MERESKSAVNARRPQASETQPPESSSDAGNSASNASYLFESQELTGRALLTGMVLGGVLSACNVYVGLKMGVAFGMSITGALLGVGFWSGCRLLSQSVRPWGILENNINQTACSAGASVASAGLVAPIPALAMLTGQVLPYSQLAIWIFSVMLVGIAVAVPLRKYMLEDEKLPFAAGIASAAVLRELHTRGREALRRVLALTVAGVVAVGVTIASEVGLLASYALPFSIKGVAARSLTLTLNPSVLLVGAGGLVGFRICCSLLLGAALAYGVLTPSLMQGGYIRATVRAPLPTLPAEVGDAIDQQPFLSYDGERAALTWKGTMSDAEFTSVLALSNDQPYADAVRALRDSSRTAVPSYPDMTAWLLWPGATLMVVASLTAAALRWRSIMGVLPRRRNTGGADQRKDRSQDVPRRWFVYGLIGVLVLSVGLQAAFFGISWPVAVLGVLLTFLLAVVAARVSGETGMTPVGAMGKVTQLLFGVITPAAPATNLMAANVTGGAASQCADLLHDLKCGQILGASPRRQVVAQIFGAVAGALVGSAVYLVLIPDPRAMLGSDEWAAPAAMVWLAVARLFADGTSALPEGAALAMMIAGAVGVALPILQFAAPRSVRALLPNAVSVGFAFVFPAYIALLMFSGGLIALLLQKFAKSWSSRFLVSICAGLIVGESLSGIAFKFFDVLTH